MKIAIHNSNYGFHPRWIAYCEKNNLPFKQVNCSDNDIIEQLKDCDALMWHHSQNDPRSLILAKPLLFSLQQAGKFVFPDFHTAWHFDDKLGQKYLLEATDAPLVPTYVFYSKKAAIDWAQHTTFPKVFKLRGGAGSSNVRLIQKKTDAVKVIRKAFGKGFPNYNSWVNFKEVFRKKSLGKATNTDVFKGFARLFVKPEFSRLLGNEMGYALFQDFIPYNDHDIRVIVIGDKAFAIKRMVRKNDFRASGSGNIRYEKSNFSDEVIKLGFEIHQKLKGQCTAMDFIFDNGIPKVVEISYGFVPEGYDPCPGFWDKDLNWHDGKFDPYGWMVEEVLKKDEQ